MGKRPPAIWSSAGQRGSVMRKLSWDEVLDLVGELAEEIRNNAADINMIVAVARGGFVPARLLSNHLKVDRLASVGLTYLDEDRTRREIYSLPAPLGPEQHILLVEDMLESGR